MLRCPASCAESGCGLPTVRGSRWCEKHQASNSQVTAERAADIERKHDQPWRAWYHTAHWKNLRTLILARDPICKLCNRVASVIADHIKPHRGNWTLFCDLGNLQGLCTPCHNEKSARELATLGPHGKSNEPGARNSAPRFWNK